MIDKPIVGMKIKISNALHCDNETGPANGTVGIIKKISDDDSFLFVSDADKDVTSWRCRECVEDA